MPAQVNRLLDLSRAAGRIEPTPPAPGPGPVPPVPAPSPAVLGPPTAALSGAATHAAAVGRGRALFADEKVGCAGCHGGPRLTNNQMADVGTGGAFQVPSLIGLAARAPYQHDGCAATLRERFDPACGGARHGSTAGLAPAGLDDLIAYLQSLSGPYPFVSAPAPARGRRTVKVLPAPASLSTVSDPPWRSTISRLRYSPMPDPGGEVRPEADGTR
jgi:mono/diheme cytochrome c family protein